MSYDINLYRPDFLRRAIEQNLGDWTEADPIDDKDVERIIKYLQQKGYVEQFHPWNLGRSFVHPEPKWRIEADVFRGSVSFSVSFGEETEQAVNAATADARELTQLVNLALHDPQH